MGSIADRERAEVRHGPRDGPAIVGRLRQGLHGRHLLLILLLPCVPDAHGRPVDDDDVVRRRLDLILRPQTNPTHGQRTPAGNGDPIFRALHAGKEGSIPRTMKLAPASTIRFRSDPLPASPPIPRTSRGLAFPRSQSIDARGGGSFLTRGAMWFEFEMGGERNGRRVNYGRGNGQMGGIWEERWGI